MSFDSDLYAKRAPWAQRAGIVVFAAALLLPMLGACGQMVVRWRHPTRTQVVSRRSASSSTTRSRRLWISVLREWVRETSLSTWDLFDHAGGRKVGHTAGQCTTFSGNATATGDVFCTGTFVLDRGQITVQCLLDSAALFGRGETLPCGIMGGAVIYRNARGDGTVQVPVNVPNQTHANFVLNVVTG
jgi:hypothetical protein